MAKASFGEMGSGLNLSPTYTYWVNYIKDNKRKVSRNPQAKQDIIDNCETRGCTETEVDAITSLLKSL